VGAISEIVDRGYRLAISALFLSRLKPRIRPSRLEGEDPCLDAVDSNDLEFVCHQRLPFRGTYRDLIATC